MKYIVGLCLIAYLNIAPSYAQDSNTRPLVIVAAPPSSKPSYFPACADGDKPREDRITACTKSIESYPLGSQFFIMSHALRGDTYTSQNDFKKAIADYSEAIRHSPDYIYAYRARAGIYKKQKNFVAAIADYSEVIRIKPDKENAYFERGLLYEVINERKKAKADFKLGRRVKENSERRSQYLIQKCREIFESEKDQCGKGPRL